MILRNGLLMTTFFWGILLPAHSQNIQFSDPFFLDYLKDYSWWDDLSSSYVRLDADLDGNISISEAEALSGELIVNGYEIDCEGEKNRPRKQLGLHRLFHTFVFS